MDKRKKVERYIRLLKFFLILASILSIISLIISFLKLNTTYSIILSISSIFLCIGAFITGICIFFEFKQEEFLKYVIF